MSVSSTTATVSKESLATMIFLLLVHKVWVWKRCKEWVMWFVAP